MSKPVKHHYIPQSILHRFCAADGQLYTFNKQVGKLGRRKYPAAVCYEENLHTVIHGDGKLTEIETFYAEIEGQLIELLKKIEKRTFNPQGKRCRKGRSERRVPTWPMSASA